MQTESKLKNKPKSKKLVVIVSGVIAALALAITGIYAMSGETHFGGARWGMSPEQITSLYPDADARWTRPLVERGIRFHSYVAKIPLMHYKTVDASFQFADDKLVTIEVNVLDSNRWDAYNARLNFGAVFSRMESKHGKPVTDLRHRRSDPVGIWESSGTVMAASCISRADPRNDSRSRCGLVYVDREFRDSVESF